MLAADAFNSGTENLIWWKDKSGGKWHFWNKLKQTGTKVAYGGEARGAIKYGQGGDIPFLVPWDVLV